MSPITPYQGRNVMDDVAVVDGNIDSHLAACLKPGVDTIALAQCLANTPPGQPTTEAVHSAAEQPLSPDQGRSTKAPPPIAPGLKHLGIGDVADLDSARFVINRLANRVEDLYQENLILKKTIQQLRDENQRLKGEQGKPDIKPSKKKKAKNFSSQKERKTRKERKKRKKLERLTTHNEKVCTVDPGILPKDARFKGYERVIVQDVVFQASNTVFLKEKYYSPSENKTYLAPLPDGYEGEFGPHLKALVLKLGFGVNMSERNILDLLRDAGISLSAGKLSDMLIKGQEIFHTEKDEVYKAGVASSPWQQIDDTSARVNGQNQYCHVVGNPLYSVYFTTPHKDRLTIIDVLTNFGPRTYLINEETMGYLKVFRLPQSVVEQIATFPTNQILDPFTFLGLLSGSLPNLGPQQRTHILDAAAISAYHALMEFPVITTLVADDAPQFKIITQELSLCWVHDGRLYKKLEPSLPEHQKLQDEFLDLYWAYYHQLRLYRENPSESERVRLDALFDQIFSTVTGYDALDDRIAKTRAKKGSLLLVLDHPELPLHNNDSELQARAAVRKRDVSFGTRTDEGTQSRDTFLSLRATTRKLGINFFEYLNDRISGANNIPRLADIITEKASELKLGASWDPDP